MANAEYFNEWMGNVWDKTYKLPNYVLPWGQNLHEVKLRFISTYATLQSQEIFNPFLKNIFNYLFILCFMYSINKEKNFQIQFVQHQKDCAAKRNWGLP